MLVQKHGFVFLLLSFVLALQMTEHLQHSPTLVEPDLQAIINAKTMLQRVRKAS